MRSVLALLAVFVGLGAACSSEEEPSGAARYTREKTQYWQVFCTCGAGETEVQPADSPCVQSYLGRQSECEEEVLEDQWDELETSAECLVAAYEEATECLQEACGVQRCLTALGNASERCPSATADAFAAACNDL